ncbi:MAG: hypothetical protein Tsb0020_30130 [Haliangiales bacterium]
MTHHVTDPERIEALAALTAIGAASPEEQAEFDALCAASPGAVALADSFDEVAAALATSLPPVAPPAGVIDAVRRQIEAEGSRPSATVGPETARVSPYAMAAERAGPRGKARDAGRPGEDTAIINLADRRVKGRSQAAGAAPRWSNVVATVAALAAIALGVLWVRGQSELDTLRERLQVAEVSQRQLRDELAETLAENSAVESQLADSQRRVRHIQSPSIQLATLAVSQDDGRAPKAKIFIDPEERRWLVLAYDLPAIDPETQDYQLWYIPRVDGAAPMPAGLLREREGGVFEADIELPPDVDIAQAAISLEKKGGVEVPTDVKMAGPLL